MHSLEPELRALITPHNERAIGALIARERRDVFSVYPELRLAGWLGATTLAAAAGIVLKDNLERLGPIALAALMAVAAVACYAWTWFRRAKASVVDDYVLLLGALLVSADVAFVESQFHLFDANWKHHLLIVAVFHALGAYAYRSRMLLSLSIVALAAWIGFETSRGLEGLMIPAFATAAFLILWREADRRVLPATTFSRTFEHFAAVIALHGAVSRIDHDTITAGLLLIVVAAAVVAWGFRTRSEPFVLYGFVFAVIGLDALVLKLVDYSRVELIILVSMVAAVAGLLALHARFKSEVAR